MSVTQAVFGARTSKRRFRTLGATGNSCPESVVVRNRRLRRARSPCVRMSRATRLRLVRLHLEAILNRLRYCGRLVRDCQQKMDQCLAAAGLNVTKFRNLKRSRKENGGNGLQLPAGFRR